MGGGRLRDVRRRRSLKPGPHQQLSEMVKDRDIESLR